MALEPLTTGIILQIMWISIGLVIFGYILNWILGLKPDVMKKIRTDARNLQERLRQAQILGDETLIFQLQQETMVLMKTMLKKQLAPMAIRCAIFLGYLLYFLFNSECMRIGFGSILDFLSDFHY